MNTMDELNEKIEDDHFLTSDELAEMKAIIQKSIIEAKKNIKLPSEIKKESDDSDGNSPSV
jgi:hypothetical protein